MPAPFRRRQTCLERRPLVIAAVFALVCATLPILLALRFPLAGQSVALVLPPGATAQDTVTAIARLDARIVRFGALPSIAVIVPGRDLSWLDLWAIGALGAIDARWAGACAITQINNDVLTGKTNP